MAYDIKKARAAGLTDEQIIKEFERQAPNYKTRAALAAGVSLEQIANTIAKGRSDGGTLTNPQLPPGTRDEVLRQLEEQRLTPSGNATPMEQAFLKTTRESAPDIQRAIKENSPLHLVGAGANAMYGMGANIIGGFAKDSYNRLPQGVRGPAEEAVATSTPYLASLAKKGLSYIATGNTGNYPALRDAATNKVSRTMAGLPERTGYEVRSFMGLSSLLPGVEPVARAIAPELRTGSQYAGEALLPPVQGAGRMLKQAGREGREKFYKVKDVTAKEAGLTTRQGHEQIQNWMDEYRIEGRPAVATKKAQRLIDEAKTEVEDQIASYAKVNPDEKLNVPQLHDALEGDLVTGSVKGTALATPEEQVSKLERIKSMLQKKGLWGEIPISRLPELKRVIKDEVDIYSRGSAQEETNLLKRIGDEYYSRVRVALNNRVPGIEKRNMDIHKLLIVKQAAEDAATRVGKNYDLGLRELITMVGLPTATGMGSHSGPLTAAAAAAGTVMAAKKLAGGGRIPAIQSKLGRVLTGEAFQRPPGMPEIVPPPAPPPPLPPRPITDPRRMLPPPMVGGDQPIKPMLPTMGQRVAAMGEEVPSGMSRREVKNAQSRLARIDQKNQKLGQQMDPPPSPTVESGYRAGMDKSVFGGQAGNTGVKIAGGMAGGGLAGYTAGAMVGDTPEERKKNAMLYGTLGLISGGILGQVGRSTLSREGITVTRSARKPVVEILRDQRGSIGTWEGKSKPALLAENAKKQIVPAPVMEKFIRDADNVAKRIIETPELQYSPTPGLSALKPNSDPNYGLSLDFSTLCKKRVEMQKAIEAKQMQAGRGLTPDEFLQVRNELKQAGKEVSCGACYVESKRMFMGDVLNKFMKQNPSIDKKYLLTAEGQDLLRREKPDVYNKLMVAFSPRGIKAPQLRTEYGTDILDKFRSPKGEIRADKVAEFNNRSGLRWQSWSDFELPHLLDGMQAIADMSMVGLKGHAYTKVPEFVDAFGETGLMINMSLIPKGTGLDAAGKLIFDPVEGMAYETAKALRQKYPKTVGTIAIGVNDAHIRALLADPTIDYVIPYHGSGLSKARREGMGMGKWDEYTSSQHEHVTDKNLKDLYGMADPKGTKGLATVNWDEFGGDMNKYRKLLAERGLEPKFPQFADDPNYYKLLVDRRVRDNAGAAIEQQAVKPVFDDATLQGMLSKYSTTPAKVESPSPFYRSSHSNTLPNQSDEFLNAPLGGHIALQEENFLHAKKAEYTKKPKTLSTKARKELIDAGYPIPARSENFGVNIFSKSDKLSDIIRRR